MFKKFQHFTWNLQGQSFSETREIHGTCGHPRCLHVTLYPPHQHFGRQPPVVALPFGLSSAPRVFTIILAHLLALLKTQGTPITSYPNVSPFQLSENFHRTLHMLQAFSCVVNFNKSALHLPLPGLVLGTSQARLSPRRKVLSLRAWIEIQEGPHIEILHERFSPDGSLLWGSTFRLNPCKNSPNLLNLEKAALSLDLPMLLSSQTRSSLF